MSHHLIETIRQEKQALVDSKKSMVERNQLGQYATPFGLAQEITKFVLEHWEKANIGNQISFLEPAVGTGVFYSSLIESYQTSILQARGIEIDPIVFEETKEVWNNCSIELQNADFTLITPEDQKYNLILTNPPYVRHHHLDKVNKERLQQQVRDETGYVISGLSGLYCYFILLAQKWLTKNAVASWLIPSEYLDVNYGKTVKKFLKQRVTIKFIHKYDPNNLQFNDALVSSSVLVYENREPTGDELVRFSFGGAIDCPEFVKYVKLSDLNPDEKWSIHFYNSDVKKKTVVLSDFFDIKRGIATGNNDFFVLTRKQIEQQMLPLECFTPLLPPVRQLRESIIESDEKGYPILDNQYFVLNTELTEETIRLKYPILADYLEFGRENGVLEGYLVKSRKIWYKQEERQPAPYYCTYMGRESSGGPPFKIIWNKSNAIVTNGYLMIYPKGLLKEMLKSDPSMYSKVYDVLSNISEDHFVSEGREYGGGLKKIEPKELGKVSAETLLKFLPDHESQEQLQLI